MQHTAPTSAEFIHSTWYICKEVCIQTGFCFQFYKFFGMALVVCVLSIVFQRIMTAYSFKLV
jgi:hypothetical protein